MADAHYHAGGCTFIESGQSQRTFEVQHAQLGGPLALGCVDVFAAAAGIKLAIVGPGVVAALLCHPMCFVRKHQWCLSAEHAQKTLLVLISQAGVRTSATNVIFGQLS